MKAKDTVMDEKEIKIVLDKVSKESPTIPLSYHHAIAKAQHEISFRAGYHQATLDKAQIKKWEA